MSSRKLNGVLLLTIHIWIGIRYQETYIWC